MASKPPAPSPAADIWAALDRAEASEGNIAGLHPLNINEVVERDLAFAPLSPPTTTTATPATVYVAASDRLRPSQQRPLRITGFTIEQYVAESATGESYWVLKNNAAATYLRLSDDQVYLWGLMDGQHSLHDLNLAYMQRYGKVNPATVSRLLDQLEDNGFIVGGGTSLYAQVRHALSLTTSHSPWQRLRAGLTIGNLQFSVHNLDARLTRLARIVNPILFHPLALAAYLIISIVGVALFLIYLLDPFYQPVVVAPTQMSGWSLLMLYFAYFISIFIHELAHALTCKRYGHEVRRGGLLLYYGLPAFFVDTDDMWLAERHQRVMVSWAGPLATLVVAALCTLALYFSPAHGLGAGPLIGALYALALMSFLNAFFNLNPLLELDGYFMLMDWLEIPSLRARAFDFVFHALPAHLRHPQSLTREQRLFTWFGLLSLIFTAFTIWLGVNFFATLVEWLSSLLGVRLAGWPSLIMGGFILALISRRALAAAFAGLRRRLRPTHPLSTTPTGGVD